MSKEVGKLSIVQVNLPESERGPSHTESFTVPYKEDDLYSRWCDLVLGKLQKLRPPGQSEPLKVDDYLFSNRPGGPSIFTQENFNKTMNKLTKMGRVVIYLVPVGEQEDVPDHKPEGKGLKKEKTGIGAGKTVFEGWIKKLSPKKVLGRTVWQKRYLKLEQNGLLSRLLYAPKPGAINRVIALSEIKDVVILPVMQGYRFNLVTKNGRIFQLMGYSPEDTNRWVSAIKQALKKMSNQRKVEQSPGHRRASADVGLNKHPSPINRDILSNNTPTGTLSPPRPTHRHRASSSNDALVQNLVMNKSSVPMPGLTADSIDKNRLKNISQNQSLQQPSKGLPKKPSIGEEDDRPRLFSRQLKTATTSSSSSSSSSSSTTTNPPLPNFQPYPSPSYIKVAANANKAQSSTPLEKPVSITSPRPVIKSPAKVPPASAPATPARHPSRIPTPKAGSTYPFSSSSSSSTSTSSTSSTSASAPVSPLILPNSLSAQPHIPLVERLSQRYLESYKAKLNELKVTERDMAFLREEEENEFFNEIGCTKVLDKMKFRTLFDDCRQALGVTRDALKRDGGSKAETSASSKPDSSSLVTPKSESSSSKLETSPSSLLSPSSSSSSSSSSSHTSPTDAPVSLFSSPTSPESVSLLVSPSSSFSPSSPRPNLLELDLEPKSPVTPPPTSFPSPLSRSLSDPTLIEEITSPKASETSQPQKPESPKTPKRIEDEYEIQDDIVLGSGVSSVVKLGINHKTKEEVAVKIMPKKQALVDEEKFREEIHLLQRVKHKNIIRLIDVYETADTIFIVTELAFGGELFDRILEQKRFSEKVAAEIILKTLEGVAYLHTHGIIHRDLKPENILFASAAANAELKISDLGFAHDMLNSLVPFKANTQLGTKGYAAPEIFSGSSYDEKVDVWSLGVIAYILLCGIPPFLIYDDDEINFPFWVHVNKMDSKPTRPLEFPHKLWKDVSQHAKSFCTACLQVTPKDRARSTELTAHPWFKFHQSLKRRGSGTGIIVPRSPQRSTSHHHNLSMTLLTPTPKYTGPFFSLPDSLPSSGVNSLVSSPNTSAPSSVPTSAEPTPNHRDNNAVFFDDPESESADVVKF